MEFRVQGWVYRYRWVYTCPKAMNIIILLLPRLEYTLRMDLGIWHHLGSLDP